MADIELVIKLDEEYIKQIDKIRFLIGGREDRSLQINVINAIKDGTPLPKGHGDLKDIQDIINRINLNYNNHQSIDAYSLKDMITTTCTIIKAE